MNNFGCLVFGRIYVATICWQFYLTFSSVSSVIKFHLWWVKISKIFGPNSIQVLKGSSPQPTTTRWNIVNVVWELSKPKIKYTGLLLLFQLNLKLNHNLPNIETDEWKSTICAVQPLEAPSSRVKVTCWFTCQFTSLFYSLERPGWHF